MAIEHFFSRLTDDLYQVWVTDDPTREDYGYSETGTALDILEVLKEQGCTVYDVNWCSGFDCDGITITMPWFSSNGFETVGLDYWIRSLKYGEAAA